MATQPMTDELSGIPPDQLAALCRRHHIRRLALFGSALRGSMTDASDIDLLVEFEPGHTPGLRFMTIERELSELFGRGVDLNTPAFLSRYFRDEVVAKARVLYAA